MPIFFAGSASLERDVRDGFIITAASNAGMLDIHDPKPLVLAPERARKWVYPEISPE